MNGFAARLWHLFEKTIRRLAWASSLALAGLIVYLLNPGIRIPFFEVVYHLTVGFVFVSLVLLIYVSFSKSYSVFKWLLFGDETDAQEQEELQ